MKVLTKIFHLNGNTIGFCPQIQKLEKHTKEITPFESTVKEVSFEWQHHRILSMDVKVTMKNHPTITWSRRKGLRDQSKM